ncbi:MAG: hypothetical protein ACRCXL_04865, partial [Dermatophilaceae bacterium]
GLHPGSLVDVESVWTDGSHRTVRDYRVVAYPTPRGCAAAYYPECNVLVPLDAVAVGSNCPVSKAVVVRLVAADGVDRPEPPPASDAGPDALPAYGDRHGRLLVDVSDRDAPSAAPDADGAR